MHRIALALALLILSLQMHAQQNRRQMHQIKGQVMEKMANVPLEMATVIMEPVNGNRVFGGMTDAEGKYSVDAPSGIYNIRFEFLSFKTYAMDKVVIEGDITLPVVYLEEEAEALDEVQVIAERSTMEVRLDKKVYNVGADLTVKGATASDVLDNVPSVTVDADGVVSLRGNDNVRILVNGKPSGIVGLNDTEALRQFPADAIEKVEVITSPSARYDAEGTAGILNIILRRKRAGGFNGLVTLNAGIPSQYGLSSNLNYRLEQVNFFGNIGYSDREGPGNAFYETEYFSPSATYPKSIQDIEYDRRRKNLNLNFGAEIFFSDNTSVTAGVLYRDSDRNNETFNLTEDYSSADQVANAEIRREDEYSEDDILEFNLNFLHRFNEDGHELNMDFQYQTNDELEDNLITNERIIPINEQLPSENAYTAEDAARLLLQADYVLPMKKDQRFEAGFRLEDNDQTSDFIYSREDENGDFIPDDRLTNIFVFDQKVTALYAQYGFKKKNFSALLGLRTEATDIDIRVTGKEIDSINNKDYVNWFPTANLVYEFSDVENISLGYNSRIRRPRSWFINPFPSQSSRTNIFQGNPDLDPSISNGVDLGYYKRWDKIGLNTSVYYTHSTDVFQFISEDTGEQTEEGIPIIRRTPINLSTEDRVGFEVFLNYTPKRNWRFQTSFNYFSLERDGEYEGIDYGFRNTSWFARFSSKIVLPAEIDWQTTMFYRGPSEDAQGDREGIFSMNLAFSKDIMKGNGTISLNVDDLFNSRKRIQETLTDSFFQYSEFQWRERQVRLTFQYRFNQKKKRQRNGAPRDDDDQENFGS